MSPTSKSKELPLVIRGASESDFATIANALQTWWTMPGFDTEAAARERAALVPRLWLQHFASTSLVAERDGVLAAFLIAFFSPDHPSDGYIHFVGVSPDERRNGLGRVLYERFFARCREAGRSHVRCVTTPTNLVDRHKQILTTNAASDLESHMDCRRGRGNPSIAVKVRG